MNKQIIISYEEYLEMEKCKKAIDNIKDRINYGITEIQHNPGSGNEFIKVYDCNEIFEVLFGEKNIAFIEIFKG